MRYRLDPLSPNGISLDVPSPVVKQGNGYVAKVQYLNELTDVTITGTPSDNQALAYDTASGKWIPQTISGGGGASQLSDLSDVNTSTPTNRNVLVADGVDFESRALVEADISDLGTYQTVLAEGAFADGDKTKLDGIEALADVTDTTNVTSAGALMDSELTSIASVKALNQGVATTDSPTFAGATLTGAAPALYLTESDQVSPAGTYRIDSSGDELRFIRSSTVLGKFNSTQFDLSSVALLLDASSNSEGLIAKSGATHIFSLYRQATPSNASAVLSAYGGIGFATGATGGAATSGFKLTIDTTGNTYPGTDSAQTLGTSSLYWSNTYTDRLYVNATAYLDGASAGTVSVTGNIAVTGTVDGADVANAARRVIQVQVSDPNGDALTTGDGKAYFFIPPELNGMNLVDADACVTTVSSSGTPTVQLHNVTDAQDMLSTAITIDESEKTSYTAVTAPVINATYDDVATGDEIRIDVDASGTGAKGLTVILVFSEQ